MGCPYGVVVAATVSSGNPGRPGARFISPGGPPHPRTNIDFHLWRSKCGWSLGSESTVRRALRRTGHAARQSGLFSRPTAGRVWRTPRFVESTLLNALQIGRSISVERSVAASLCAHFPLNSALWLFGYQAGVFAQQARGAARRTSLARYARLESRIPVQPIAQQLRDSCASF
jgi:hypothetical protein